MRSLQPILSAAVLLLALVLLMPSGLTAQLTPVPDPHSLDLGVSIQFPAASTGQLVMPDGSAASPALTHAGDLNAGLFFAAADQLGWSSGGTHRILWDRSGRQIMRTGAEFCWDATGDPGSCAATLSGTTDLISVASGDDVNIVLGQIGRGAQTATVDAATTFALTSEYVILECTGAESIDTISGGRTGVRVYIEHTDTDCTLNDDDAATASDAIDLTGTATNDAGAAAKIVTLLYNGSHWYQVGESDN